MKALKTLVLLFISLVSFAQKVLSPEDYLGFSLKERFAYQQDIEKYCEYIVNVDSNRFRRINYGKTPEGRSLFIVAAAQKNDLQNLEAIQKAHLTSVGLSQPTTGFENKLILWLSFNIHGDEASGSETALRVLHYLTEKGIPDDFIILIDPNQNPDGRERYVQWFQQVHRHDKKYDPTDVEYNQQWPHGRFNHFLNDLNRDWLWQVQPESKQRMSLYHQWMPHVHIDFHEMEPEKTYFFPPSADPVHELVTREQENTTYYINSFLQKLFNSQNWDSFSKEEFDLLYPSYADSYSMFNGGIGLTMEQGGSDEAGMFYITATKDTITLESRVEKHLAVAKTLIQKLPELKDQIIENFRRYYQPELAQTRFEQFVIKNTNGSKIAGLVRLLDQLNIKYHRTSTITGSFSGVSSVTNTAETFQIDEGDLVISLNQPKKRLIQILFEPETKMGDHKTYDISSWSLPYLHHLESYALTEEIQIESTAVVETTFSTESDLIRINYNSAYAAELLTHALKAQAEVYLKGALGETQTFLKKGTCTDEDWAILLSNINRLKLEASNLSERNRKKEQIEDAHRLSLPRIGIAFGEATNEASVGDLITLLETKWQIPYTRVLSEHFDFLKIEDYDVLIFADGNYRNIRLDNDKVKRWLANGGKMILMEGGLDINHVLDIGKPKQKNLDEILYSKEKNEPKNLVQGAFFKVDMHPESILSSGFDSSSYLLIEELPRFEVKNPDRNLAGIINAENHLGGYVGSNARRYLHESYILGTYHFGNGGIHQFTVNPLFRGILMDGQQLFANALFLPIK
ncbi:M14 family metallopeptidase [Jiulongibacter sediminis]|jgi:hypothetical protein|uniref:M14 family metallopeptidase n=1 Tax=Jiulongibacter sediminis TaxID=1605367 RepID=UPI0026EB30AF|nr:M14 family metallopeptidase [Jiulongibacter sediminis]